MLSRKHCTLKSKTAVALLSDCFAASVRYNQLLNTDCVSEVTVTPVVLQFTSISLKIYIGCTLVSVHIKERNRFLFAYCHVIPGELILIRIAQQRCSPVDGFQFTSDANSVFINYLMNNPPFKEIKCPESHAMPYGTHK